jgi:hypothetical protein
MHVYSAMRLMFILGILLSSTISSINGNRMNVNDSAMHVDLIDISQQLLYAAKTKEPTDSFTTILKNISENHLLNQLANDNLKKAFWINIYNAYTQVVLSKNPDKYKKRGAFFSDKQIVIAQKGLSLDDIEHGILRHSKVKWGLGHFNKLFPGKFEKQHRVDTLDYRIHFSLNCGAKSCPPIAFYSPDQLDKQLNTATKVYLKGESEYNEAQNTIALPALMGWFRGDFNGKSGMKKLLKLNGIIPENKSPSVNFKKYDWNLFLENYKSEQ